MKTKSFLLMLAAGVAAAFSACSEQMEPTPTDIYIEQYTKSFIRTFGLISHEQDWNMASRMDVTVNVEGSQEVKVYAWIDGMYYLVADYNDVTGKRRLEFDAPEGTRKLKVAVGPERRDAMVGGTVDFTRKASRAGSSGGINVTELTAHTDKNMASWLRMQRDGIMLFNTVIPEEVDNRDKITHNFLYESTGPFIIHPVYWDTYRSNTLGIYYYSNDADAEEITNYATNTTVKIKRIPVFKINDGNQNVFVYNQPTDDNIEQESTYIKKDASGWRSVPYCLKVDAIYGWDGFDRAQFMSRGILVDVPIGMKFGMYIDIGSDSEKDGRSGRYFYSQSDLNPDPYYERTYKDGLPHTKNNKTSSTAKSYQACHAGTFIGSEHNGVALTFEDWNDWNNDSDMDMNDMVFVLFGAGLNAVNPEIISIDDEPISNSPYQWIIGAEDLGSIGDFDFNDVVVGVQHVAGQTTAKLTALAAGGTFPVKLLYNGEVVRSSDGKEQFHHWFVGDPDPSTMINTFNPNQYSAKPPVEITVSEDYSLASMDVNHNIISSYANGRMGGFSIEVERTDGTFSLIEAPGIGTAPQMICMPGGWVWPREQANISKAYTLFSSWVAKPEDYAEWYKTHYNTVLLTGVPHYVDSGSGTGSGTGTGTGTGTGNTGTGTGTTPATAVQITVSDKGTLWGYGDKLYKFTYDQGFTAGMTMTLQMNVVDSEHSYVEFYLVGDSNNINASTPKTIVSNGGTLTLKSDDIANMTNADKTVVFYGVVWGGNTIESLTYRP